MTYYLDVQVVRIQHYLARTPTLRARRAASSVLAAVMDGFSENAPPLAGRARRNREAGEVDGVLSLVLDDPREREPLVDDLLAELREKLPAAQFQVVWGEADTYPQARGGPMRQLLEHGEARDDLPAAAEFPAVARCQVCRSEPAIDWVGPLPDEQEPRAACADCVMRHQSEAREQGGKAEARLMETIGAPGPVDGFEGLVTMAERRSDATQMATLHVDGNRIGAFISALTRSGTTELPQVVARLNACTFESLAAATCAVRRPSDAALCAVPHVLGGDDVLVSVPADRAWKFTVTVLGEFASRMHTVRKDLGLDEVAPTASAGLVFSRHDHPFALVVEETERCLKDAKKAGAGQTPFVQFSDLASSQAGGTRAVPLAELRHHRDHLTQLASLPRSHRARLTDAYQARGPEGALTLATRLGRQSVIGPFLTHEHDETQVDLAEALQIARWWR